MPKYFEIINPQNTTAEATVYRSLTTLISREKFTTGERVQIDGYLRTVTDTFFSQYINDQTHGTTKTLALPLEEYVQELLDTEKIKVPFFDEWYKLHHLFVAAASPSTFMKDDTLRTRINILLNLFERIDQYDRERSEERLNQVFNTFESATRTLTREGKSTFTPKLERILSFREAAIENLRTITALQNQVAQLQVRVQSYERDITSLKADQMSLAARVEVLEHNMATEVGRREFAELISGVAVHQLTVTSEELGNAKKERDERVPRSEHDALRRGAETIIDSRAAELETLTKKVGELRTLLEGRISTDTHDRVVATLYETITTLSTQLSRTHDASATHTPARTPGAATRGAVAIGSTGPAVAPGAAARGVAVIESTGPAVAPGAVTRGTAAIGSGSTGPAVAGAATPGAGAGATSSAFFAQRHEAAEGATASSALTFS